MVLFFDPSTGEGDQEGDDGGSSGSSSSTTSSSSASSSSSMTRHLGDTSSEEVPASSVLVRPPPSTTTKATTMTQTTTKTGGYCCKGRRRRRRRILRRCRSPSSSLQSRGIPASSAAIPLTLLLLLVTAALLSSPSTIVTAQETDGAGTSTVKNSCTHPAPTCSSPYHKLSDETAGLSTSCPSVTSISQTSDPDPVLGLTQTECQSSCDALEGCDTINYRWRDPNFEGESTCYRKQCGDFGVAACTLGEREGRDVGRDVYTKSCGTSELWGRYVEGNMFDGLFGGVQCPREGMGEDVGEVLDGCGEKEAEEVGAAAAAVREEVSNMEKTCSTRYYKLIDEFNGQSSSCPLATVGSDTVDPILDLDQSACQSACDALGDDECDTIEFRWRDPTREGRSTCYRRNCGNFDAASCSMVLGQGRDVYTKACGAEAAWEGQVVTDADGLFAAVECARVEKEEGEEGVEAEAEAEAVVESDAPVVPIPASEPIDCTAYDDSDEEPLCVDTYYKISDESNGLATSCAAVDQTADPVVGLDQAGCQAACDALDGCDTINFRWKDPNFNGESTCYRKNCGDFKTAACTLFSKHKSRDVYTKACGSARLFPDHVITDGNGLFAGVQCPDETAEDVVELLDACAANDGTVPDAEPTEQSCTKTYYKISDEFNGLATSCAAVDQTADPVVGLDQAGCQAACDALDGCDTINFRWKDPNFNGDSTCYRKNCGSFETAACTLFSKHKSRDVYTKACGAQELWPDHVLTDGNGLFAGVRCPADINSDLDDSDQSGNDGPRVCTNFISTNRTNSQCDVCGEWSGGGQDNAAASVRTCLIWEKTSANGISSCKQYAPSALQLQQRAEYNKFLQARWSEVGVCDGSYIRGTTCEITREDGSVCEVRDQPCHGGTELGGVAGVLSAGWQMTFGTAEDNHVCTMCGRGTFGSCDDACAYRRNFFWSGYNLGSIEVQMDAAQVLELLEAFVTAQPEEKYEVPQTLKLIPDVLAGLSEDHPLSAGNLPSQSIYSIISVDDVLVTVRDQLLLVAVGLKNAEQSGSKLANTVLSTSGVKVYETCKCFKCPRGQFQDGLGETSCKSCNDILPGSDTSDTGADGPELCQCLASNDVFLSSDGTRCVPCDLVRSGEAAAPPGVCQCDQDTYEMDGSSMFPSEPDDWITCAACPEGSTTFNAETKAFDYGESVENCYCMPGTYAVEGGCSSCPALQTSPPNAESASECHLTDAALLMAIVIPTGIVVFGVLLGLINLRFRRKIAKLEAEKRRQMQEKVNEATETVNHLAHPMVFVSSEWFLSSGRMVKHEDARTKHCLFTVDTTEELKGFKKGNTLIFFSHQWLAWSEPDPHCIQYKAMVSALEELVKAKNLSISNTYIWLDYTSIPQTHRGLQRLSINSLTNYAGACDYFVVVAPGKTMHADTGTLCDKASYQERAWCRAEQLAHGCRKGVENMYLTADGGGLEPVTWDWIKPSFKIFSGRLTCCARGHEGMEQCDKEYLVTPVLGLYCELLAADKDRSLPREKKEVLDFMKENEEEVFPPTFEFSTPGGKRSEDRELFGDILTLLDELDLKSEDLDDSTHVGKKKVGAHQSIVATEAKRASGNTSPPSDSSGENVHPPKTPQDNTIDVQDKV